MAEHKVIDRRKAKADRESVAERLTAAKNKQGVKKQKTPAPAVSAPAVTQNQSRGSYYSPREYGTQAQTLGAQVETARKAMEEQSAALRTSQKAVETARANEEKKRQRYYDLQGKLEGDGAAALYQQIEDEWTQAVQEYGTAKTAYDSDYQKYLPFETAYNQAVRAYNGYLDSERAEYDNWRSTIRDGESIRAEQKELKEKRAELERLMRQSNDIAAGTAAPGVQAQAAQTEQRIKELQDYLGGVGEREKLLQEELGWSEHFLYEDLRQNADFAEMSRFTGVDNQGDRVYQYVNGNPNAVSGSIDAMLDWGIQNEAFRDIIGHNETPTYLEYMTDEEKAMYNYVYSTQGRDAAQGYLDYLKQELTARKTGTVGEIARMLAGQNGFTGALFSGLSVPMNAAGGIQAGLGQVASALRGEELDPNASYNLMANTKNAVRDQVSGMVEQSFGPVGSFLYGTGMSIADMAMDAASGNPTVVMATIGSRSFSEQVIDAKNRGLSDEEALAMGVTSAFAELITERIGLDELLKLPDKWADAGFWKGAIRGGWGEAKEEGLTNLMNLAADISIAGDKSEFAQSIERYKSEGMSDEKAMLAALKDAGISLALDAAGGAISGGIYGGIDGARGKKIAEAQKKAEEAVSEPETVEAEEPGVVGAETATTTSVAGVAGEGSATAEGSSDVADRNVGKTAATVRDDRTVGQTGGETVSRSLEELKQAAVNRRNPLVSKVMKTAQDEDALRRIARATTKTEVTAIDHGVSQEKLEEAMRIRELTGKEIIFEPKGQGFWGFYDPKADEIHLAADTGNIMAATFGHELTHSIEGTHEWERLVGLVKRHMAENGESWDALRRQRDELYADTGHANKTAKASDGEALAYYVQEHLLTNEQSIRKLVRDDRSIARRILDWLDGLWAKVAKTRGSREREFVRKAREIYRAALAEAEGKRKYHGQIGAARSAYADGNDAAGDAALEAAFEARPEGMLEVDDYEAEDVSRDRDIPFSVRGTRNEDLKTGGVVREDAEPVGEHEILTDGATVTGGDGVRYSIRSMNEDIAEGQMFADLHRYCGWTQQQTDTLKRELTKLVEYMTPHREILDMNETYGREGRKFSPYKPNSDPLYKISMDFSTLCSKRLLTQYVIENLQLREQRPMTAEEQMAIRDMLNEYRKQEKGIQVACAMCYVEAARLKAPGQITRWMEDPETHLKDYFAKKNPEFKSREKQAQEDFKESRGYKRDAVKKDMKNRDVTALNQIGPRMRQEYQPSEGELEIIRRAKELPKDTYLSAGNLADLSEREPEIYAAYSTFVRNATRAKALETDEPYYYGDSRRDNGNGIVVTDSFIENVNRENGMRFSSWSDWRIQHMLDYITAVIDNSVRGAAMHGYTKFPEEVRVLGNTGMMFNMSGVAGTQTGLNQDGSLSFSETESINVQEAVELRERFPETAGLQCIGVSDEHIEALLDSDIIDYVIPYHVSGLNASMRRMADIHGWRDYTGTQHAVIDKGVKLAEAADPEHWHEEPTFSEFFVGYDTGMTGQEAMEESARRYVQMCRRRGMKPKFEKFVGNSNYWKLLIDRKMINQQTGELIRQKPVRPEFDFDEIRAVVDRHVANYDSNLEARALKHVTDNWDSIPQRIQDLKKAGKGTKAGKTRKALDTLANETLAAVQKGEGLRYSIRERDSEGRELSQKQQEFFRESKVRLDEDGDYWYGEGRLAPVYHATDEDFTVFLKKHLGRNADINAFDPSYAATAHLGFWFNTGDLSGGKMSFADRSVKAYLNITNPYDAGTLDGLTTELAGALPGSESPARMAKELLGRLKAEGYDGIVIRDEEMGGMSFVAFESNQIKRTDNDEPTGKRDIRYSIRERDSEYEKAVRSGDMQTAQRMVDEAAKAAGYLPVVRWHQTKHRFNRFNTDNPEAGLDDSETPNGIFFKDNDHDIGIGGNVQMELYLKSGNVLHFENRKEANAWYRENVPGYGDLHERYDAEMQPLIDRSDEIEDQIFETEDDAEIEALEAEENEVIAEMKAVEDRYRGQLRKLLDDYFLTGRSGYDSIELDYDGHRWVNGKREDVHTYIAFDPAQAKSAKPVTYDDSGNVVPLSERFNDRSDDIRYSIRETEEEGGFVKGWHDDDEAARAAQMEGYPVINGVQVVPMKTWVLAEDYKRDKAGNIVLDKQGNPIRYHNMGLVAGLGGKPGTLKVNFHNKNVLNEETGETLRKDGVEIAYEDLTPRPGVFSQTDEDFNSLVEQVPEEYTYYSEEELAELEEMSRRAYQETNEEKRIGNWESIDPQDITGKAKEFLEKGTKQLARRVAGLMYVPRWARQDFLDPIVNGLINTYLEKGTIDQEFRDELFETAWREGRVVEREFYDTFKDVKDYLRTTPMYVPQEIRDSIGDFDEYSKRIFGKIRAKKERIAGIDLAGNREREAILTFLPDDTRAPRTKKGGGVDIADVWDEVQQMAPALFPDDILNEEDRVRHMLEVAGRIRMTEMNLDEFYAGDLEDAKRWSRNNFEVAVQDAIRTAWEVRRVALEQKADMTAVADEDGVELTEEEITALYPKLKDTRKAVEKAMAKNLLNKRDKDLVQRLLRHDIQPEHLDPETDNVRGILAVYEAKKAFEEVAEPIRRWNKQRKARLYAEAEEIVSAAERAGGIKDKGKGFLYSRETMERNLRDIVKDRDSADRMVDTYIKPIHEAEAAATRMKNEYRQRVKDLDISRKVKKGDTVSEAYAVQFYGEVSDILRMMEESKFRLKKRDGKTYNEWKAELKKLWEENPGLDKGKIENAAGEMGKIYEELFAEMNRVRVHNGYEPINHRSGYFPHFQQDGRDGILGLFGKAMGIDVEVQQLPTSINGMTHTFKPGIRWFGNALERKGFDTAYDAVEGFDRYIEGVASVVHQTENIQRLRALANQIRYRTGDEGLREQIRKIQERTDLTDEEKDTLIQEKTKDGKFQLSNFVVELDEYTNLLANKKSRADRNMEQAMGRDMYNIVKGLESRVAANMVAINPGSWLTNFIPITQGWACLDTRHLLVGMGKTLRAMKNDDGMVYMSDFLTNRQGSDPLVKTAAQEWSGKLSSPMEFIDNFTAGSLVRARYAQNLSQGLSVAEAMSEADEWVAGVMADRSRGSMPTMFHRSNPLTKVFTQFQLEVNNQLGYMLKDIPREKRKKGVVALALALLKLAIGAWAYNELYEKFLGRRPALDPIDMVFGFGKDVMDPELDFADAITNLGGKIAENTPFIGGLLGGGRVPISSALPDWTNLVKVVGDSDWSAGKKLATAGKELAKPLTYMVLPFGGGQVKKIWEAIQMIRKDGSYTVDKDGNPLLQYPLYSTNDAVQKALEAGQAMLFGKTTIRSGRAWVEGGFKNLSADQTATYQALVGLGVEQAEAFELMQELREAEKTDEQSRAQVQRDILRASGLEGDALGIVYYDLMVDDKSKEKTMLDELQRNGADMGLAAMCLMGIKDADAMYTGAQSSNAKRTAILGSGLEDKEKQAIYRTMISDERDDDIDAFRKAGMDMDDFLIAQNEYTSIKERYEDEGDMATAFARWVNQSSYNASQKEVIRARLKYWQMMPANADRYDRGIEAGLGDEKAAELAAGLDALEPMEGKTSVADVQKYRVAIDQSVNEANQLKMLQSVGMTGTTYEKVAKGYEMGLAPAAWVRAQEAKSEYDADGNGSMTQAEIRSLIDGICTNSIVLPGDNTRFNLTNEQKAVLWQMMVGKNTKSKNNPYSPAAGQRWRELMGYE